MTTDRRIIIIPTSIYRGSWLEELEEELLLRGVLSRVEEKTGWSKIDKDLIHDIIVWRCRKNGDSICPAVALDGEKAYLLMLDEEEEKFVKLLDFEKVMEEEIRGVIQYSECLAKYGYDYPC
jgi:hypothetical protein